MGIKNFQQYAETFFGLRCFKEFNVSETCYGIKNFTIHEICARVLDDAAKKRTNNGPSTTPAEDYDAAYERCGLYVDLASFVYGNLLKSLEKTEQYAKLTSTVDGVDETKKLVVCELESGTVERIAADCANALTETLRPLLLHAYRVYLAYDTCSPRAKFYEQACRKRRSHFSVAYAVRTACYERTVVLVKEAVRRAHLENLRRHVTGLGLHDLADAEVCVRTVESAVAVQFPPDSTPFGEGEWKVFYRICDDFELGLVDGCVVLGRDWDIGFAMTMFQHPTVPSAIRYAYGPVDMLRHNKRFDAKERALHFACLMLIGNDYVGGLVNPSVENLRLFKKEFDKMYGGDAGPVTARQLDFLSETLFGEGKRETDDTEDPATQMNVSVAFATVFARLLSAVYNARSDGIEDVICGKSSAESQRRPSGDDTKVKRKEKGIVQMDGTTPLVCKDARGERVSRTFQQVLDTFATAVLWYLSYTRFYFCSQNGKDTFSSSARPDQRLPMSIGLRMGVQHTFTYNDERLSPSRRYDVHRLLDVRRVLRNIDCHLFLCVLQRAFQNALHSNK